MSDYIERDDYLSKIRDKRLEQLTNSTPTILDNEEETAIQVIRDSLSNIYDVDVIFAKRGTLRDKQVVRWACTLVMYYVYARIPDKMIPDRIENDYDETIAYLKALESGKRSCNLPKRQDSTGRTKTLFRWGSKKGRSH